MVVPFNPLRIFMMKSGEGCRCPRIFGRNLDALADVLSTDIPGPFEIMWNACRCFRKALKNDFVRIEGVLKHVAAERADFG